MVQRAASVSSSTWVGRGRISKPADVARVLAAVNATGLQRANTAELRRPVEQAERLREHGGAGHLSVHPALAPLLPGGLRRGSTVAVVGSTSLVFAALAQAMAHGSYAAIVGASTLGLVAAQEHEGVDLSRLALVPHPGPDWPSVVGALIDGLDVVVVDLPGAVPVGVARVLAARARRQGAVLMPLTRAWPACDVVLTAEHHRWGGLGVGQGRLREHHVVVSVSGRGAAAHRREVVVPMPLPASASLPAQDLQPVSVADVDQARRSA